MAEVVFTDEFGDWYGSLREEEQDDVAYYVDLLEQMGVGLGYPHSCAINGSRHPLRELRCKVGGRPFRIIYAFNPVRDAVLILGGDKGGDNRFYETIIARSEVLWDEYLATRPWESEGP